VENNGRGHPPGHHDQQWAPAWAPCLKFIILFLVL
jgi:hypothetical protein